MTDAEAFNPRQVFNQAETFGKAADLIRSQLQPDQLDLGLPLTVNRAFSIELYLKSLLILTDRAAKPSGHKSHLLFAQLRPQEQAHIREKFRLLMAYSASLRPSALEAGPMAWFWAERDAAEADVVLKLCADAFVNHRYAYEGTVGTVYGAREMALTLRSVILELRPEWAPRPAS